MSQLLGMLNLSTRRVPRLIYLGDISSTSTFTKFLAAKQWRNTTATKKILAPWRHSTMDLAPMFRQKCYEGAALAPCHERPLGTR